MNRAVARRPVFLGQREVRFFLSRVAREVRRGTLEVHAYVFLTTHFHMYVRSPVGELSEAMMRIEGIFARWFNVCHERDGPLFRSRFLSRRVDSVEYGWTVQAYVDWNGVDAGLATRPEDYPFGSAAIQAGGRLPRWLRPPSGYPGASRRKPNEHARWVIDRRVRARGPGSPLDALLARASPQALDALVANARAADGVEALGCIVSSDAVRMVVRGERDRDPDWSITSGARRSSGWSHVEVGLLRSAAGEASAATASLLGLSKSKVQRMLHVHRTHLIEDPLYAKHTATVLEHALQQTYPHRRQARALRSEHPSPAARTQPT